jgi:hypothetical protein
MQNRRSQNSISRVPVSTHPLEVSSVASIISLEPGLFAIAIGSVPNTPASAAGRMTLPLLQVTRFRSPGGGNPEMLGEDGLGETWLGSSGGVVVILAPPGGAALIVTSYAPAGSQAVMPAIQVDRLGHDVAEWQNTAAAAQSLKPSQEISAEILLHVERLGDCRFSSQGWVGPRGRGLRIEGFGIMPLQGLSPRDLEYKAFQPGGAETPWVGGPQLCGSRGRRLPLTGFAIRPAAALADRFDVVYSGAFLNGGIVGPRRNGEPCRPALLDDPLEAMTVSIVGVGAAF